MGKLQGKFVVSANWWRLLLLRRIKFLPEKGSNLLAEYNCPLSEGLSATSVANSFVTPLDRCRVPIGNISTDRWRDRSKHRALRGRADDVEQRAVQVVPKIFPSQSDNTQS